MDLVHTRDRLLLEGLAIPATMAAALEIVPRQRSGVVWATVNAARQTGTVLGPAGSQAAPASTPPPSGTGASSNGSPADSSPSV